MLFRPTSDGDDDHLKGSCQGRPMVESAATPCPQRVPPDLEENGFRLVLKQAVLLLGQERSSDDDR